MYFAWGRFQSITKITKNVHVYELTLTYIMITQSTQLLNLLKKDQRAESPTENHSIFQKPQADLFSILWHSLLTSVKRQKSYFVFRQNGNQFRFGVSSILCWKISPVGGFPLDSLAKSGFPLLICTSAFPHTNSVQVY